MNKKLPLYSLCLIACFTAFRTSAQSPTAPALGFNVFVQRGAHFVTNETEGPVAIGGDLTVDGNYQVSTNYTGTFTVAGIPTTLVVGGKVNYASGAVTVNQNGYAQIGNATGSTIWYTDMSGHYSPMRITPGSDYNGGPRINLQVSSNTIGVSASTNPVCHSGVDFNSAFTQMKTSSICMSGLSDNTTLTDANGNIIAHTSLPTQVKINLHTGINVLNLRGADLSAVADFTYNNNPDASHVLVINVNAPGAYTWLVYNSAGIGITQCPYIIYNFYNTTTLNIDGSGAIEGTVFAPIADITKKVNTSNVEGQVIAQSYYHAGGENHYAVFGCGVSSCGGPVGTVTDFTTNYATQCMDGNYFVFSGSVTGTPPFTYHWSFGDGTTSTDGYPVKTYTATGTYTVKLVVNGAGGADSVTHSVTVDATPTTGFAINDTVQSLSGNSFMFTSNGSTATNTYSWDFGDGTHSSVANPVKTYTATGTYIVHQQVTGLTGCTTCSCIYHTVYVICDSVTTGSSGGLESESLGDLVSRRTINNIKNSVNTKPDYATLPPFRKNPNAERTTGAGDRLQQFTPASLDAATQPLITTPADITSLTSAVDVFSVDYESGNNPKAVVLAITTTGKPYNHTKSICDRFRGATLVGTSVVAIQGINFIQFQLQQQTGQMEYCIAFAAGKSAGSSNFHIQSKWLISEYTSDDSVFNFQVWAASPLATQKLANDILNNLAAVLPLQQTDANFVLPPAYIASGKRNKGFLDLTITNTTTSTNGFIIFEERKNEFSGIDTLEIPFTLAIGAANTFHIPIYDGYEYEGHLFLNDTLTDDVYMADGNWSIDYDKTYTTLTYKPDNNYSRVYVDGEYPLYRDITVSAVSNDYVSIYKFITSGEDKVDLSAYHSYKFLAKGAGKMQVKLIKSSVVKWADQYYTTINLDSGATNYQVSFDDFASDNLSAPFDPSDVTAVVYTFLFNGVSTNFNFYADEQAFSPTVVTSVKALQSRKVTVSPNPASSQFQCSFAADQDRDLTLTLSDISGSIIYKQLVHATTGQNKVSVSLPSSIPDAMLIMSLSNNSVKYNVTKISILH